MRDAQINLAKQFIKDADAILITAGAGMGEKSFVKYSNVWSSVVMLIKNNQDIKMSIINTKLLLK